MIDFLNGGKHCDDYIDDPQADKALRDFLFFNRLPAWEAMELRKQEGFEEPKLFADFGGKRVRVVMASRLGNVGITDDLSATHGYTNRVLVEQLSNFSTEPRR